MKFDITNRQNTNQFAKMLVTPPVSDRHGVNILTHLLLSITHTYPDLDCIFLNAGVQSPIDLAQPTKVDLSAFHSEVNVNFLSFVNLTVKFLPFLINKNAETSLI